MSIARDRPAEEFAGRRFARFTTEHQCIHATEPLEHMPSVLDTAAKQGFDDIIRLQQVSAIATDSPFASKPGRCCR